MILSREGAPGEEMHAKHLVQTRAACAVSAQNADGSSLLDHQDRVPSVFPELSGEERSTRNSWRRVL